MISEVFGRTHIDDFLMRLARICLIEVGVVSGWNPSTGKCTVDTYRVSNNHQQKLNDVELMWIGNSSNGFVSDPTGSHCLVFFPRTPVPSLRDNKVKTRTREYDFTGAKAILLSTAQASDLRVGFDAFGQFCIESQYFTLTINDQGIELKGADAGNSYTFKGDTGFTKREGDGHIVDRIESDGTVELQYRDNNGMVNYRMNFKPDGTYTIQRAAKTTFTPEQEDDPDSYDNWTWETIWQSDGSETQSLKDADKKELVNFTRGIDGSLSYIQSNADGEALNTITISADGDISITNKAESSVTVLQDGTITLSGKQGITVDGADGKVSVKNGTSDLLSVLNDFADNLKADMDSLASTIDSLQTAGSPANHSMIPGQTTSWKTTIDQNIAAFKQAVAGVFQ